MLIVLQNEEWLAKQRVAGKIVSGTLDLLASLIKKDLSLIEMDVLAEEFILSQNAIPTFKGYKGFPNSVCISVNKQLVHSIATDYHLKEGDIVSFDLGATVDGAIGDAARTFCVGETKQEYIDLINTTKECLQKAIDVIAIDKPLGCIGNAIFKHARDKGYSVVDKYGGHGISVNEPHASPFVQNRANSNEGIRFQKGMTIAIEPLLVIGSSNKTTIGNDNWTVYCENICAHEEHTLYIHDDHVEIITK